MLGIDVIEADMPMDAGERIPLVGLVVAGVAESVTEDGGEPKDKFLDMLIYAKSELASLPADEREYAQAMLSIGFAEMAAVVGRYRDSELREAFGFYNRIGQQIASVGHGYSVNRAAVLVATNPVMRFCTDTCKILDKITPHLGDEELADALRDLRSESERLYYLLMALSR